MTEELKNFLDELLDKERKELFADVGFALKDATKLSGARTIVPLKCRKRLSLHEADNITAAHGLYYLKECVVKDAIREIVRILDESGLVSLDARFVEPDQIEFQVSLDVIK